MIGNMKFTALTAASASLLFAALPADAAPAFAGHGATSAMTGVSAGWNHGGRHWDQGEYRYNGGRSYDRRSDGYDGPVWRGRDGRYRCRRNDGTTGLLIGTGLLWLLRRQRKGSL